MIRLLVAAVLCLVSATAVGQTTGRPTSFKGPVHIENGGLDLAVVTVPANATTVDVSYGNFFVTSANTGATAITDFLHPTKGQTVTLCGGSDTNSTTIAASGYFSMQCGAMTLALNACITLLVKADNSYVELHRNNCAIAPGPGDDFDVTDTLTCGDAVIDEAAGVLNFSGATSASVSTTSTNLTLTPNTGKVKVTADGAANHGFVLDGTTTHDALVLRNAADGAAGDITCGAATATSVSVSDGNVTNVGDIDVDSISPDNTDISVTIGAGVLGVGDGTYSWGHTPQVGIEGVLEVDGDAYLDAAANVGTDLDVVDTMTCGDAVIDEAAGVLNFSGGTSATVSTTTADLTLKPVTGKAKLTADGAANHGVVFDAITTHDTLVLRNAADGAAGDFTCGAATATSGSFSDGNITNVGDLDVDSISPDATDISITIGAGSLGIGDGTYSWGHTPQVGVEGVFEVDGEAYLDAGLAIGTDLDVTDTMTCGDAVIDEAAGVLNFSGGTSATVSTTTANLTLKPNTGKVKITADEAANHGFVLDATSTHDTLVLRNAADGAAGDFTCGTATVGNTGLVVGSSTPFSDSSGTLTLQNVDALDATTEATVEDAIDTLANLTSVQSQTVSLSGALTVEAGGCVCNQDLTSDASPTFGGVGLGGGDLINPDDIYSAAVATDAAPRVMVLAAQPVVVTPGAANTTGANLVLAPSPGARTLTGVTLASTTGDTLTFVVYSNGVAATTVKTEGSVSPDGWDCDGAGSDAECVCNLYALLTGAGAITGVTVTRSDGTCSDEKLTFSVTPGTSSYLTVTPSDAVNTVISNGTNGVVTTMARVTSPSGALNLGTSASTGHSLTTGDLITGGKLEVDGAAYFDGETYIGTGGLWNTSYFAEYGFADDGAHLVTYATDGAGNNNFIITKSTNYAKDHDHETPSADPTLFVHSSTDPDSDNTEWMSVTHNQTDGVISTGKGVLSLTPAAKGVRLPVIDAAAPSEPVACGATTVGIMVYVNDNNDGAAAELCICAGITNDSTYDWVQVKDMTTACTFF